MTNTELKQLRTLLFLDVTEAAQHIGDCEPRTWQRWEKGDRAVPVDVAQTMQMLALTRVDMLQVEYDAADPMYQYFSEYEDFKAATGATGASVLKWRLAQSVSAQLVSEQQAEIWRAEETI
ncbi:Aca2/YdiL-like domain-containing protein [Shewanella xiamenensis]|uniref:Aca2/YdiL-like domain-containing protein n=1 Tax=Shewanella xiamenensis TaxID=332186 RepID=UPI0004D8F083|nr:DUF1870 family protein [Shewanella xiamenensis]KEK29120.1 hypothetical protein SXM_1277 [Shewanella xiamenensis]